MEAARFGFDPSTPPAFKFDPTDADIVAHYLLPRALGIPDPPFAHAVVDDDPCSLPPQDLLAKHGYAGCHHAFFLDTRHTPDVSDSKNAGRRQRVVKGGAGGQWRGQNGSVGTVTLLRPGGGEVDIRYRRYDLSFYSSARAGAARPGWVMRQYQIVSPPLLATVLSHIKMSSAKIKEDRLQAAAAAAQHQQVPEQPGPRFEVVPVQEQPDPRFEAAPVQEQPDPRFEAAPVQEQPDPRFNPSKPPFKFGPTDGDIVAHYLLPRALGLPDPPFAHAVVDDDPGSLPPQDLFAKHGHAGSHQAFFLDTPDLSKNAGRMQRVVKGGTGGLWRSQKTIFGTVTLQRPGVGKVDIRYKRYDLTFFSADGGAAPTGWVMRQYQIVSPPLQATVLSHIKMSAAKIKKDRLKAAAQHQQVPEQPDPRYEVIPVQEQPDPRFDVFPVQEQPDPRFNVFPTQEQPDPGYHHPAMTGVPELAGPSHQVLPVQGQPGPSHHHPDLATMGGGSGQTDAPRGGIGEGDYSLYAGDGVAGDDDNNLWPRCDFRSFGGESEYSPLNVHDHDRGYFQTLLCI